MRGRVRLPVETYPTTTIVIGRGPAIKSSAKIRAFSRLARSYHRVGMVRVPVIKTNKKAREFLKPTTIARFRHFLFGDGAR